MNTSIPIRLMGCEHNGANESVFQPIAWPVVLVGTTFGGNVRTANLDASTFRRVYLWLPPRERAGVVGRVVIATAGKGSGGSLVLPTYQVVRIQSPACTLSTGAFDSTSSEEVVLSSEVTDTHTSGNWTSASPLLTNINLGANTDIAGQPLQGLGHLQLRIRAPYGTGGGSYGMYVVGLAVQDW